MRPESFNFNNSSKQFYRRGYKGGTIEHLIDVKKKNSLEVGGWNGTTLFLLYAAEAAFNFAINLLMLVQKCTLRILCIPSYRLILLEMVSNESQDNQIV